MFKKRKDRQVDNQQARVPEPHEDPIPEAMLLAAHGAEVQRLGDSFHFGYRLELEMARARRYERPLALLTFTLGLPERPPVESSVLEGLMTALRQQCRPSDIVGRAGQNTIGVILPETGPSEAQAAGGRLFVRGIRALQFSAAGSICQIGHTGMNPMHQTAADMIGAAWLNRTTVTDSALFGDSRAES